MRPPLHQPWRGNRALLVVTATRGLLAGPGGRRNLHDPDFGVKAAILHLTRIPVGNHMVRSNLIKANK